MQVRTSTLRRAVYAVCCCAMSAACTATTALSPATSGSAAGPADAAPGTCWNKTETPAVIETVSEQILVAPAQISADGVIRKPAQYRRESRQKIAQPRQENWYQIICSDAMTAEFVAVLQRALMARGFYAGDATGRLDSATRDAIAHFQSTQNLPGSVLTVAAAQELGLIAVQRS